MHSRNGNCPNVRRPHAHAHIGQKQRARAHDVAKGRPGGQTGRVYRVSSQHSHHLTQRHRRVDHQHLRRTPCAPLKTPFPTCALILCALHYLIIHQHVNTGARMCRVTQTLCAGGAHRRNATHHHHHHPDSPSPTRRLFRERAHLSAHTNSIGHTHTHTLKRRHAPTAPATASVCLAHPAARAPAEPGPSPVAAAHRTHQHKHENDDARYRYRSGGREGGSAHTRATCTWTCTLADQ